MTHYEITTYHLKYSGELKWHDTLFLTLNRHAKCAIHPPALTHTHEYYWWKIWMQRLTANSHLQLRCAMLLINVHLMLNVHKHQLIHEIQFLKFKIIPRQGLLWNVPKTITWLIAQLIINKCNAFCIDNYYIYNIIKRKTTFPSTFCIMPMLYRCSAESFYMSTHLISSASDI